ncbi:hypothetical protein [Celeribacter sp. PS-C1]|uniref:hypothetical protein n=1 Tax=Celeribacter sp. PS-C1 TaxID=2820813 RepID=UPI001CA48F9E|nr:hypothetical protein [Celeribacter sp. PS-C1]MBW6419776.1 hypothetical protein [Celeribacter sp. PS-C1]
MLKSTITALSLLALSIPVMAAEPGGKAWGSIGGEEIEIPVWVEQSDFGTSHLSILFRGPALRERGFANLSLGAEWSGNLDGDFFSAEIDIPILSSDPRRKPQATRDEYRADLDDGLSLTITNSAYENGTLVIAGRVEATLIRLVRIGLRSPDETDPSDTLDVNLTFEAIVSELQ